MSKSPVQVRGSAIVLTVWIRSLGRNNGHILSDRGTWVRPRGGPDVECLAREVAPGLLLILREQFEDLLDGGPVSLLVIEVNHSSVRLLRNLTCLRDDRLHFAPLRIGQLQGVDVLGA